MVVIILIVEHFLIIFIEKIVESLDIFSENFAGKYWNYMLKRSAENFVKILRWFPE